MRLALTTLAACLLAAPGLSSAAAATPAAPAPAKNPCTNGSFEKLTPAGFPVDWEPVGQGVAVSKDAHTGKLSLRMVRTADANAKSPHTGLNRAWRGRSGQQGAMLDRLKGGIDFWYKAVSAKGATQLRIYAIPMSADPIENTGAARVAFDIPRKHIGDGKWHNGKLAYDFTDNSLAKEVKWVHFAARIHGPAGELLLDDMQYVGKVGPLLRFGRIHIEEDPTKPGHLGTLKARLVNAGDQPARNIRVKVTCPPYLKTTPAEFVVGHLPVKDSTRAVWRLEGRRDKTCELPIAATAGPATAQATFEIAPKLLVTAYGPKCPVVVAGQEAVFVCHIRNTGNAVSEGAFVQFLRRGTLRPRSTFMSQIAPGTTGKLNMSFPADSDPEPGSRLSVGMQVSTPDPKVKVDYGLRRSTASDKSGLYRASVLIAPKVDVPEPSGTQRAIKGDKYALLENKHVRLVFLPEAGGPLKSLGLAKLQANTGKAWRTLGWIPVLNGTGVQVRDRSIFVSLGSSQCHVRSPDSVQFRWEIAPPSVALPVQAQVAATFRLPKGSRSIECTYTLTARTPLALTAFHGPWLLVSDRAEAVFPGAEWLTGDETSSSALDIEADHPHRRRFVPHPNMVTIPAMAVAGPWGAAGVLWDPRQQWTPGRCLPSAAFDSPAGNLRHASHLMGLFLPDVPQHVAANQISAAKPYVVPAGKTVRLRCHLYANGEATDALSVIDEYIRLYGLPKPRPLPHGSWDGEIAFSMQAYLKSLWDAETKQWWSSMYGNPIMSKLGRQRHYVMDLLRGAQVTKDVKLKAACLARAREVLALIGGEERIDAQRFPRRADLAMAGHSQAAGLLATRRADGSWRFDADRKDQGVFKGADYYELGPDDALEVGTCARNAYVILRYARISGDWEAYERMRKTLLLMEKFRVPRAAQVWEVPVHTPDILAAADAVDAYMEAYRFSGDKRWLKNAVLWARRGLPFVYLWDSAEKDDQKPWLLGASIPVFGATWYRGSWFGRPVQWNGLRYANALLTLAEHDKTLPWKEIAELLIRSAVWQQEQDPTSKHVALWQDWVDAVSGEKCHWKFGPRQIIRNMLKLTGRDEDPRTVIVGKGGLPRRSQRRSRERLHLTTMGTISDAKWDREAGKLTFRVTYPKGEQGVVLVSPIGRPDDVLRSRKRVQQREGVESGTEDGWRYDAANGYLSIRVAAEGTSEIEVQGAAWRSVSRIPAAADRIAFEFDKTNEGWLAQHHIADLSVHRGMLAGKVTGGDPYVVRPMLRVATDACPVVRLRMRLTAGAGAQLYWTTDASPHFGEDKVLGFRPVVDGKWHDYVLRPGRHAMWKGRITSLRIDPGNGATKGEFGLEYVRGGKE